MSDRDDTRTDSPGADGAGVSRRRFVAYGAAAGALAWTGGCTIEPSAPREEPAGEAAPPQAGPERFPVDAFELDEVGIADLRGGLQSGRWSAEDLVRRYLERIEAIDRDGPTLRTVIEANPDALLIARGLDRERRDGETRGPLHGIPILVKDNVATADGMTTTAGALALAGTISPRDSFVAARLRAAGAIILGKANLSEWANFRSTRSSSGWSGRGGQCRNPYVLDRNPCGSSSGSAAAAAASLCAAAIGTETNGSIVCPASANGIVGIKPTVGLVSRSLIVPIADAQDTAGPMARTVRDAAIVLGALTGQDPDDPKTAASRTHGHNDYTQFLDAGGLRGARIGVVRDFLGEHEKVDALMEDAILALREGGAEVIDPVEVPNRREVGRHSFQVLLYEFKAGVDAWLQAMGDAATVRTLADVIAWNEANAATSMPYFGQELLIQAQEKGGLDTQEYLDALESAARLSRAEGLDVVLREERLDALIGPTGGPAWVTDLVNGDNYSVSSSTPAAVSGYPNVTVPAGRVQGLPVGISFFGAPWSEPTLLRIAYAFEQATNHRARPEFLRSL
ncbi:MAG TPA: amidase [Longimicrobiales bacterium]|nr:amidase [Longimicrobiales bacterium]